MMISTKHMKQLELLRKKQMLIVEVGFIQLPMWHIYNTARQIADEPDDEYEFPESITLEHQPTTARDSVYAQVRHGAEPDSV